MIADLEYFKAHGRKASDNPDDVVLQSILRSANAVVLRVLHRTEDELFDNLSADDMEAIKNAVVMYANTLDENRESHSDREVKMSAAWYIMLNPFRRLRHV